MPRVSLKRNETFDNLLKRFARLVQKSGIMKELRKRQFYSKKEKKWRS